MGPDASESAMTPDAHRPSRLRRLLSAIAIAFALATAGLVAPRRGGADAHTGRRGGGLFHLHVVALLGRTHRADRVELAGLADQRGLVQLAVRAVQLHRRHVPEP
nr:hypothetical protein GCM10020092_099140 [Actinoplanes digitatis]